MCKISYDDFSFSLNPKLPHNQYTYIDKLEKYIRGGKQDEKRFNAVNEHS